MIMNRILDQLKSTSESPFKGMHKTLTNFKLNWHLFISVYQAIGFCFKSYMNGNTLHLVIYEALFNTFTHMLLFTHS
jgi:hypothetical protein